MQRPKDIGILDMQIYFPRYYVDQSELEEFNKIGKGKYTIGLGQEKMAFAGDREDINSVCLTVVDKVLKRNNIEPSEVGRLEVGTETFLDKSKSIKTYLMDFFKGTNYDIEGVTTSNACYGGTNALFNAINWMSSEFYDGRYAIVVAADIAVYAKGNARPTGGCGAVAMLIGPNAPIVFENVRATYMNNVYDFYKPNPVSEYPTVDGNFSLDCYFKALESCYENFVKKHQLVNKQNVSLDDFDFFCFHSPFAKMVEKAFIQLVSYDLHLNNKIIAEGADNSSSKSISKYYPINNPQIKDLLDLFSKRDKNFKLDPKLVTQIKNAFDKVIKTALNPSLFLGKNLGNLYTGSLYAGLLSLILDSKVDLANKRLLLFSYGSGCAASLFSLKVNSDAYIKIRHTNPDTLENLNNKRIKKSPYDHEMILARKEKLFLVNNYTPEDDLEELFEGTYYIEAVDDKWRRLYSKKGKDQRKITYNKLVNKGEEMSRGNLSKAMSRLALIRNQLIVSN